MCLRKSELLETRVRAVQLVGSESLAVVLVYHGSLLFSVLCTYRPHLREFSGFLGSLDQVRKHAGGFCSGLCHKYCAHPPNIIYDELCTKTYKILVNHLGFFNTTLGLNRFGEHKSNTN